MAKNGREQGPSERVHGKHVEVPGEDHGRRLYGVDESLDGGADSPGGR